MLPSHFLKMDKSHIAIVKKGKEPNDVVYWLSRPAFERILMVEQLRADYHGWNYESIPRLQRVYRIVKRKSIMVIQDIQKI